MPEAQVIADTGPLVAFLSAEDAYHAWALERFQELPAPFLTCEPVLTETFHLVSRLKGGTRRFFELLDTGLLEVRVDVMASRRELKKLVLKYADVPMSLADACLVRLAELEPKATVFTIDGDFLIYRRSGRQRIPVIIPPGV